MVAIRSRFSKRKAVVLDASKDGRTKQSMRDECDINNIMSRYISSGTVTHIARNPGVYGHAPAMDFRECVEFVRNTEAMFMGLPAAVRREFENDPYKFLIFAEDPKNIPRLKELGLGEAKAAAQPPIASSSSSSSSTSSAPPPPPAGGGSPG